MNAFGFMRKDEFIPRPPGGGSGAASNHQASDALSPVPVQIIELLNCSDFSLTLVMIGGK